MPTAVLEGVHPALGGQGDYRDLTDGHGSAAHVGTIIMSVGQSIGYDPPEDEGALKPLPERLVIELTAHRAPSGCRADAFASDAISIENLGWEIAWTRYCQLLTL